MNNKKGLILSGILLLVLIMGGIYTLNRQIGNTVEARQNILSKRGNHVIILREIVIEDSVISETLDQKAGYGYAQFERNEKGNYILKTKMVKTLQEEPVLSDNIVINGESYEILMCNASGLQYAEVTYTDETTGKVDDPIRVDMNNYTVQLIKVPEYSSYKRSVVFYNEKGDRFE